MIEQRTLEQEARLHELLGWLEAGAPHKDNVDGFSMSYFSTKVPDCGTVACMVGAVVAFEAHRRKQTVASMLLETGIVVNLGKAYLCLAGHLLGMTQDDTCKLFADEKVIEELVFLNVESEPKIAAEVLRKFISTGKIDWHTAIDNFV